MKTYIILLTFFCHFQMYSYSSNVPNLEKLTKFNKIQNPMAVAIYNKSEIKVNLPKFTNRYIDRKSNIRTDIPSTIWNQIKNNIDYTNINNSIISAIESFYSPDEMSILLDKYKDFQYIPIAKIELWNELSFLIEDFNFEILLPQINAILINEGYTPLSN